MSKLRALPVILLAVLAAPSFAAQSPVEREKESKQAAAEEAEARKINPEALYADYTGLVTLFNKEQKDEYEDTGVVGVFTTEKATYYIKLDSPKVLKDITPLDGKTCTVSAKIRNEGKYIIIQKIVVNSTEFIYKKRRGGVGM